MKKLRTTIRIALIHSTHENDQPVHLEIKDETSGTLIMDLRMSLSDFGELISGNSGLPTEARLYVKNAGKRLELKKEEVYVFNGWNNRKERKAAVREAVTDNEVDGWTGRDDDAMNSHNRLRGDDDGQTYTVGYRRFTETDCSYCGDVREIPVRGELGKQPCPECT